MLTMILGGLWHGAAWNFTLWGLYHGLLLSLFNLPGMKRISSGLSGWGKWVAIVLMFHLTCLGWLLFRVESMPQLMLLLKGLVQPVQASVEVGTLCLVLGAASLGVWILDWWTANRDDPRGSMGWHRGLGGLACAIMVVSIILLTPWQKTTFIYFQF